MDLVKDFDESDCEVEFPIYRVSVKKNVKKGMKRRELFDKSSVELSNCLPIFNPMHLIIRDMLDCILGKKYLSTFCN